MSATAEAFHTPLVASNEIGRWSSALVFVVAAHVLLGVLALSNRRPAEPSAEPPAAVLIELAPASPSESPPSTLPPAPSQVEAPDAPIAPTEEPEVPLALDRLDPDAEVVTEPAQHADARPLPVPLDMHALDPATDVALDLVPEAVAEPVFGQLDASDFTVAAETEPEPVHRADARPLPELQTMDSLAPSAETAAEPPAEATAEPVPETIDMQSLAASVAENPEAHPGERPVEADPKALQSLAALGDPTLAPLPRPRPEVVPAPPRAEEQRAQRPPTAKKPAAKAPPRRTARRKVAARPPAPETTAPSAAPQPAAATSAPRAGAAASTPSVSPERWRSAVYRHLERKKRYPREAESRRISGTVHVRFTIDRSGNILSHRITQGSGHPELDQAASAMIGRASPVPAPPPELYRSGMSIEVPVRFAPR